MNKKTILSFVLGSLFGAGGCYIFMKRHYDKLLTFVYAEPDEDELFNEEDVDGEVLINPTPELVVNARKQDEYKDYTKYHENKTTDRVEDLHPVDSCEDEAPILSEEEMKNMEGEHITEEINKNKKEEPKIISVHEYGNIAGYETTSLLYYVDDDVLATEEDDEYISDEQSLLGDCMERMNWKNTCKEGQNLYVRNYQLATDYEVIPVMGSYSELVGDRNY